MIFKCPEDAFDCNAQAVISAADAECCDGAETGCSTLDVWQELSPATDSTPALAGVQISAVAEMRGLSCTYYPLPDLSCMLSEIMGRDEVPGDDTRRLSEAETNTGRNSSNSGNVKAKMLFQLHYRLTEPVQLLFSSNDIVLGSLMLEGTLHPCDADRLNSCDSPSSGGRCFGSHMGMSDSNNQRYVVVQGRLGFAYHCGCADGYEFQQQTNYSNNRCVLLNEGTGTLSSFEAFEEQFGDSAGRRLDTMDQEEISYASFMFSASISFNFNQSIPENSSLSLTTIPLGSSDASIPVFQLKMILYRVVINPPSCIVSSWSSWTECGVECIGLGAGNIFHQVYRYRYRKVVQAAGLAADWESPEAIEARQCPPLSERMSCAASLPLCPTDCVLGGWTPFEPCDPGSCDPLQRGPDQMREAMVLSPALYGGISCLDVAKARVASEDNYTALTDTLNISLFVPEMTIRQYRVCPLPVCAIPCRYTDWSDWDSCDRTCVDSSLPDNLVSLFSGVQRRTRALLPTGSSAAVYPPECSATSELWETKTCNEEVKCPVNCETNEWGEWGACDNVCGGFQTRMRQVQRFPKHAGIACPALNDIRACESESTANENGDTSETTSSNGGVNSACEKDCILGNPIPAVGAKCSQECDGGKILMQRPILRQARTGGVPCSTLAPELEEYFPCNEQPCSTSCITSDFSEWGSCTQPCGEHGLQFRFAAVLVSAKRGTQATCDKEAQCPRNSLIQSRACNRFDCTMGMNQSMGTDPVFCTLSEWSTYDMCSCDCASKDNHRENATQRRYRNVEFSPSQLTIVDDQTRSVQCGGESLFEEVPCPQQSARCIQSCIVSEWGEWSACSGTCLPREVPSLAVRVRERSVLQNSTCHDSANCVPCEDYPLFQQGSCESVLPPCPSNCVMGNWSAWSSCSVSCGSAGVRNRYREIILPRIGSVPDSENGEDLECVRVQQESCANINDVCPTTNTSIGCLASEWAAWSTCHVPSNPSASCTDLLAWEDGQRGVRTRVRTLQGPVIAQCELVLEQSLSCPLPVCSSACQVTEWSLWSSGCTHGCNYGEYTRGLKVRMRDIVMPALTHRTAGVTIGAECPHLIEQAPCGGANDSQTVTFADPCPEASCLGDPLREENDCAVLEWSNWTRCTRGCGFGAVQYRAATKVRPSTCAGRPCNGDAPSRSLHQTRSCPLHSINDDENVNIEHDDVDSSQGISHRCGKVCIWVWGAWSTCDRTCGYEGTRTREPVILQQPESSAGYSLDFLSLNRTERLACPPPNVPRVQEMPCGVSIDTDVESLLPPCADDCVVSDWGGWTACTGAMASYAGLTCGGGGQRTRHRSITSDAINGGTACPALEQLDFSCADRACPQECSVAPWSPWSPCSLSCVGSTTDEIVTQTGTQWRMREVPRAGQSQGSTLKFD